MATMMRPEESGETPVSTLASLLAANRARAEAARCVPVENVTAMCDAGLTRAFRPAAFGGGGEQMRDVLPVVASLAEHCPASAWVLAVLQIHEWLCGLFPQAAQEEVFGAGDRAVIGGVLQPRGRVLPTDDGYRLEPAGWPFASGIDHAGWALVGALLHREAAPPDSLLLLLAPGEYAVEDDWDVTGLAGTGSKRIVVTEPVTVPSHRTVRFGDLIDAAPEPALPVNQRAALLPMLSLNVTGPALGGARSALKHFESHLEGRCMPFSPEPQAASALTQRTLATARTRVDVAAMLLGRAADEVAEAARAARPMPLEDRSRVRVDCAWAVRECATAVDELWRSGGGGLLQRTHPLNALQRDVQAMQQHAALNLDNNLQLYGATLLNQPLNSPFV